VTLPRETAAETQCLVSSAAAALADQELSARLWKLRETSRRLARQFREQLDKIQQPHADLRLQLHEMRQEV
jgi:hypothetical protein